MIEVAKTPVFYPERSRAEPTGPYPARLFEAVHQGLPGDLHFYRCAASGATSVLELGCGSGRVLESLSGDGHRAVGLDIDADLLAQARRRVPKLELIRGDMRTFPQRLEGRAFDRIFCPFNGMYCLLERGDLVKALEQVAQHLTEDGLFVFDGYSAEDFHQAEDLVMDGTDLPEWVKTVTLDGTTWDVFESSKWNRETQQIDATYHHVSRGADAPVVARIPQRYMVRSEIEGLLAEAGLELLVLHGDFDQSAWEPEAPNFIVTARLARVHA